MNTRALILACVWVACSSAAIADTVGYWRFEGVAGVSAEKQKVPSEVNPKEATGVGVKSDNSVDEPKYSSETPGAYIYDPVTKTSRENKTSMKFAFSADGAKKAAAYVEVPDSPTLRPTNFTLEGFIKHDKGATKWLPIIQKQSKTNPYQMAWALDTEDWHPGGIMKMRLKLKPRNGTLIQSRDADSPTVTAEGWHHFAYTFDSGSGEGNLYWEGKPAHKFVIDDADKRSIDYAADYPLFIGGTPTGGGWPGWLDEVRLSDRVLTPEQFLQASDKVIGTLVSEKTSSGAAAKGAQAAGAKAAAKSAPTGTGAASSAPAGKALPPTSKPAAD